MLSSKSNALLRGVRFAHTRVAIVGGGAAGACVAGQLARTEEIAPNDITVFDKKTTHYYQASQTMIGGGVLGINPDKVKKKEGKYLKRPMVDMIYPGVNLHPAYVETYNPKENEIVLDSGEKYTYDYLVVCPGIYPDYD